MLTDIKSLHTAAQAMQAAAPTPAGRGWDASVDKAALDATNAAWKDARTAYEHTEGALAPIFPDIDFSIDARYDDYLAELPGGDSNLFDDRGVTGLHGAERILYSDVIPANVVAFESTLMGYAPAAFPASAAEASDFKTLLLGRIITDAETLEAQWTPAKIDLNGAFGGLVSLMNEQREKVNKAATGEEESRYSQRTMTDIRDNLEGTRKIYVLFQPWLRTKTNATDPTLDGPVVDAAIEAGFDRLDALYAQTQGQAIPTPPATWSSESPSATDLMTDFGKLYTGIQAAVAHDAPDSIVFNMNQAAIIVGFDQFKPIRQTPCPRVNSNSKLTPTSFRSVSTTTGGTMSGTARPHFKPSSSTVSRHGSNSVCISPSLLRPVRNTKALRRPSRATA